MKKLNTKNQLESWENYYIGKFNSIDNGYNKKLSVRRPSINYTAVDYSGDDIKIMDEHSLKKFLLLNDLEYKTAKDSLPRIDMNGVIRYEKQSVMNYLLKTQRLNNFFRENNFN